jgi:hypothetical protein
MKSKTRVSILLFQNGKTRRNRVFSILTSIFELLWKTCVGFVVGSCIGGREGPCRETSPGHGRNPTRLFVFQKVIVKNRKNITSNFLQLLFIFQSSSIKCMTTFMLTGRQHNFQDVLFLVERKDFGTGVITCPRTCVFLQLLLDLPRERTWKMGPIKHVEVFDPVFFRETFRFQTVCVCRG